MGLSVWRGMKSNMVPGIASKIEVMGYILAIPAHTPVPSYYELEDGTILSVLTRINHALVSRSGGAVSHSTETFAFTPHRHMSPKPTQPKPPTIIDQDVKFTLLREEFNEYSVGNDITVSAKAVVSQVAKFDTYSDEGEPIYSVNSQPVFKVVDKRRQPISSGQK